jgi:hypothetical protein
MRGTAIPVPESERGGEGGVSDVELDLEEGTRAAINGRRCA